VPDGSDRVAPDARGLNFHDLDRGLQDLLGLYLDPGLRAHLAPHLGRLGALAGGPLDEQAALSDRHPPVLHHRDRFGRDEDWIEFHPAYREMERIGFLEFGIHALSRRAGILGWPRPYPPLVKYVFQYLFVQAEFGLMCPISVTDTCAHLVETYADDALRARYLPGLTSVDPATLLKGGQFMTEKAGGSDVGQSTLRARPEGDHYRLHGEKWFCSCADADVVLLLARPEGAVAGSRGLGLFLMPRRLEDGRRNHYRIVRLKDKLGTRSMASGEVIFEGAVAYPVGPLDRGLRQMMDQVNLSRLSHGVRAAAMMRRCLNEALQVARHRSAFDRPIIQHPLLRRQLVKLMVPAEQALSVALHAADVMGRADRGDPDAARELRLLTPVLKLRSCRDNIRVATGAMEVRGGNGYIEDWVNARLIRDAHVGVLWEGTSNINALDVIQRAVGRERAHDALRQTLHARLDEADGVPEGFRARLRVLLDRAIAFAGEVARHPDGEPLARQAGSALYHATSAALMTWEAARVGAREGDARRLLLARMVAEHRLEPRDPLRPAGASREEAATDLLLGEAPVPLEAAAKLVGD
jgi:alkylation response protein AidB-like acyl-CoA dehydrogenase